MDLITFNFNLAIINSLESYTPISLTTLLFTTGVMHIFIAKHKYFKLIETLSNNEIWNIGFIFQCVIILMMINYN